MSILYTDLQRIYRKLNKQHFNNKLPECIIRWHFRFKSTIGDIKESTPLIRLNFQHHKKYGYQEIRDTLLHEMIHLYLHQNGKKSYHDHGKDFKKIAKQFGLKDYGVDGNGS